MALFVVVVIGGLQLVQASAENQLVDDREAIAETEHLGTVASTTSTPSTVPGPTTTAPTTTTETTTSTPSSTTPTTVYGGVVTKSCSGDTCSFGLDPAATASWTISPNGNDVIKSGQPPGTVEFKKAGSFTVTATVAGTVKATTVVCTQTGNGNSQPPSCI